MRNFRKVLCVSAFGMSKIKRDAEYCVRDMLGYPNDLSVYSLAGRYIGMYEKSRFEEIEMKTPPEPCKCKQTTPVELPEPLPADFWHQKPLSETSWRIVKNNIAGLYEGLKASRTTPAEVALVMETCLFILKGK